MGAPRGELFSWASHSHAAHFSRPRWSRVPISIKFQPSYKNLVAAADLACVFELDVVFDLTIDRIEQAARRRELLEWNSQQRVGEWNEHRMSIAPKDRGSGGG